MVIGQNVSFCLIHARLSTGVGYGDVVAESRTVSVLPPISKLANLDAVHVDGARQSVPVKRKWKKVETISSTDKNKIVSSKIDGKSMDNDATKTTPKVQNISLHSSGSSGGMNKYTVDASGCFKKLTPITAMKLTDPRSEKLSIASLRRRFGVAASDEKVRLSTSRASR